MDEYFNQFNIQLHKSNGNTFHQNITRTKTNNDICRDPCLFSFSLASCVSGLQCDWKTENPEHLFIYWRFDIHHALLNHSTNTQEVEKNQQPTSISCHCVKRIRMKKCISHKRQIEIPIRIIFAAKHWVMNISTFWRLLSIK